MDKVDTEYFFAQMLILLYLFSVLGMTYNVQNQKFQLITGDLCNIYTLNIQMIILMGKYVKATNTNGAVHTVFAA